MIRIDPNVTEMPKPIAYVDALVITSAVVIGRALLASDWQTSKVARKGKYGRKKR